MLNERYGGLAGQHTQISALYNLCPRLSNGNKIIFLSQLSLSANKVRGSRTTSGERWAVFMSSRSIFPSTLQTWAIILGKRPLRIMWHLPELVFVVWRWHLMLPCAKPMLETAEYAYFRLGQEQMFNRWRIFQAHGYQPFRYRYRWVF